MLPNNVLPNIHQQALHSGLDSAYLTAILSGHNSQNAGRIRSACPHHGLRPLPRILQGTAEALRHQIPFDEERTKGFNGTPPLRLADRCHVAKGLGGEYRTPP